MDDDDLKWGRQDDDEVIPPDPLPQAEEGDDVPEGPRITLPVNRPPEPRRIETVWHMSEPHVEIPQSEAWSASEQVTDSQEGLESKESKASQDSINREKPTYKEEDVRRRSVPKADGFKIGILGGTSFGKTYLFHAIAFRLVSGGFSGALSYYDPTTELWEFPFYEESGERGDGKVLSLRKFLEPYTNWIPIKNTEKTAQKWYRLRTQFRSGLLGQSRSTMDIEFLDGAGEGFESPLGPATLPTWKSAYSDASFMIFCLPIWAVFPSDHLSEKDREFRKLFLQGFDTVLTNYLAIRNEKMKVRTILALTMADDRRSSLHLLRERWINPIVEKTPTNDYLRQMRGRRGATRYLASARAVSNYLHKRFRSEIQDPFLHSSISKLDLGMGMPTMIPVTSLEGSILDTRIAAYKAEKSLKPMEPPPVPAHVELPLLAALCERYNILM